MSGYCIQCDKAVYLNKEDAPACPVCFYPLSEEQSADATTQVSLT